ncbi:MAG: tRNA (adenosine(37)-N6)-threonylcarbamoyltransferase complex dimerization subunit type 1 TsaB [Burkholderiales bacterium]|nr:tRNA (adenosine(37)-N6)-threonylcarbamoyltransferase complex dimerization subunit type 1 TsaB [Burkholderiales bacterium]
MKILAFDTSTAWLSVAVRDGARLLERDEHVGHAHSSRLLPLVDELLDEAGLVLVDLDAIAFGAGPGAFTGVRVACSVAQGLALGAGRPLVPISTLAALAQTAWRAHGWSRVVACLDARMREVYVASMVRVDGTWCEAMPVAVTPPAAVVVPPSPHEWFGAGDGFAAYPDLATQLALGGHDAALHPQAAAIGELAQASVAAGTSVAAAEALPLYVRHRIALTTAERNAGQRL